MPDEPHRRDLFYYAGAVAALTLPAACRGRERDSHEHGGGGLAAFDVPARELEELTIAQLQERMASGAETAESLVDKYRARIEATNERGPKLRAVLELDPDAAAAARALDAERAAGKLRGPLHGIPLLIKDNIDTAGKTTTTAGSLALEGSIAPRDAFAVARLRAAGAVILGKANLSEWANFRGAASTSGWSARGGQCRNPYALDRSPSGSSSGSGAATAANLCAAALGTESDGSVVSPSSCNGLVGIKPTIGLVSRAGLIPISTSQDTAGPMARTVADAAALLAAIAGPDPEDPVTLEPHPLRPPGPIDYTRSLDPNALKGARIGVPRKGFFGTNRNVDAVMTAALAKLKELGAELVDPAELKIPPDLGPAEAEVFWYELKASLADYFARRRPGGSLRTLEDVIAFNVAHADREMHFFGQENFELGAKKGPLTDKAYLDARAKCIAITRDQLLDKVMTELNLDAFVAATSGPAWLIDPVNGDAGSGASCSSLPAISGYPHVTVPGGQYFGLPVGLSFFGAPYSEPKLIGYAYAWEQATRHRRAPRYLSTVELA
jgi:amidase